MFHVIVYCALFCALGAEARTVELGRAMCVRHLKRTFASVALSVLVFYNGRNLS